MPTDVGSWVLVGLSFAATFVLARTLGTRWRRNRASKAQEAARRGESRQVRRARERRSRA